MSSDTSNVLNDLITLSKDADRIISDSNLGNEQISQWFSIVKETAVAIAKGTYSIKTATGEERTSFSKNDLPSLVTLVKGKQNSHRLSNLLAEQNRVHLSHRKSRKSLRKIVLGKKSGNQWKISNRKSSVKIDETVEEYEEKGDFSTPKIKDKLLESQFSSSMKKDAHSKSYFSKTRSSFVKTPSQIDFSTPAHQSKEILAPNTDETTPAKRPKLNFTIGVTEVKEKKNMQFSVQNIDLSEVQTPIESSQLDKADVGVAKKSSGSEGDKFVTPTNNTIVIESDSSANKTDYKTPLRRSKRKSSVQQVQDNAKKIKCLNTSQANTTTNTFKHIKSSKDISSVIPGKSVQQQNVQTPSEKRILREIQKKEEKVSQNTKKLKSLREMKIEENKKAREKKMEKAMQLRKKIEKEKEERIRSRTQSKQENLQQLESASKKATHKKVEAVIKKPEEPPKRPVRSPVKKISPIQQDSLKSAKSNEVNQTYVHEPSPKEISNTKMLNALNATYLHSPAKVQNVSTPPPKPIRNAKKPTETSTDTYKKPSAEVQPATSTPSSTKIECKTSMKTPVSNKGKKPNSYAMTPHESSFVCYDMSEIKSDDSDTEESVHQKPIPSWASGYNLKNALLKQHYAPTINIDEIFGNHFPPPVLSEIMGMEKKHYHKRTSSAIWLNSPNRSRTYN